MHTQIFCLLYLIEYDCWRKAQEIKQMSHVQACLQLKEEHFLMEHDSIFNTGPLIHWTLQVSAPVHDRIFVVPVWCYLGRLTAIQEVPGSIPGYNLEIFLEV